MYIERNYVYIAKLENKYCPVAILRRYIEAANLELSSHLPLFRSLTKNKSGYSLRNGKLSYTRCREIFKTTLKDLGHDPKEYGLHNLRYRGPTAVISNNSSKAVSERLLKLHGRWKTDEAKDMYVLESEYNRLRVVGIKGFWDNFKSTKINLKTNSTKTFMLPPNSPQLTQNSNNSSFAKINTNM